MNRDIRLRIEGSLLERLINRAMARGARFTQVKRSGKRAMTITTDERSAAILISLCEKYFLDCRILHRRGTPALRDFIHARWTLIPALLICIAICALFLNHIWLVDVCFTGPRPELGDRSAILSKLKETGVNVGMPARQIDTELVQKQLLAGAGDYSFIGVRRQGIRLLVEAAPEVPSPETYQIDYARDLVASRDGVVESISVHAGSACVKPGDTVRAGQTLIRGEEAVGVNAETQEEITSPVSALGEVVARCWYEGSAEAPLVKTISIRTGQTDTSSRIRLMGLSLPLKEGKSFSSQETETQVLPIVGLFLPLELERSTHFETRSTVQSADPDLLATQLEALARAEALTAISGDGIEYETAASWTDAKKNGNTLRVRAVYEIYTDIAVTRDALIEEVY